jgi:hypothetical protein
VIARLLRTGRAAAVAAAALAAAPAAAFAAPIPGPAAPHVAATPAVAVSSLPAATCAETTAGHRSCDLWAKLGSTDLPGLAGVPVWGFVSSNAATPVKPGGPNLIVNQGDVVSITLHNALPAGIHGGHEALSLGLPSAPLVPDTAGVVQGAQRTYTFTAARPGTFIYEAGPTDNARHQVAMGLAGALIVRPPGLATASLTTALGANADLTYTAAAPGAGGNAVSIEYADPGAANSPLAVAVAGNAVTVSLATDAGGAITSTAADVRAAVSANPAAAGLVAVALAAGSDGSGTVTAFGPANLAGGQSSAYGAASAFDDEAVLVLSELDPAVNTSADPSTFDMKGFQPTYRLINGRTYHDGGSMPSTEAIDALPDDDVLVRYVNAGLDEHSMGLLGADQMVLATNGNPFTYTYGAVAETVGAGATMDALVHVPASAVGRQLALMDEGQHLDLAGAGWKTSASSPVTAGGMLTFVRTAATTDTCSGPVPTAGTAAPSVTDATTPVAISATFSACTPAAGSQKSVDRVEFFVDNVTADGSGTDVPVGSPAGTVAAAFTVDPTALAPGAHTVYVHAHDDGGLWGAYDAETFFVDAIGPDTTGLLLDPAATNGGADVALSGTASDLGNGDQNVDAAEYRIDSQAAAATPMTVTAPPASVAEITGTIPQSVVNVLSEGAHAVYVRSHDALGNWGAFATITLTVDKTGPSGSAATFGPSPNNGTLSIDPNTSELQFQATFTDPVGGGVSSAVRRAEGFLDTPGAAGSGVVFVPTDGAFGSTSETAYSRFPLAQVNALAQGPHVFYAHAQDAAGNWGPYVTATLVVDRTGPNTGGLGVTGNVLTGTATDPVVPGTGSGSAIQAAEWFEGADPGPGSGNPMTASDGSFSSPSEGIRATLTGLVTGSHTISVRALDAAGNWGPTTNLTFTLVPTPIFANGFASGNLSAWSSATGGAAISASTAARLHGADAYGMQVTQANGAARYVQDNTPANELEYSARFYFNPHGALTGAQTPTILAGRTAAGVVALQVQYQRVNATTYRVRAGALATGGVRNTNWFTITNATHSIEVDWRAVPAGGFLRLYTDGALRQTLNAIPDNAYRIESVRLGPSATLGAGLSGVLYFDDFVSQRGGTVGP